MNIDAAIGLEVHVQLNTKTKTFVVIGEEARWIWRR